MRPQAEFGRDCYAKSEEFFPISVLTIVIQNIQLVDEVFSQNIFLEKRIHWGCLCVLDQKTFIDVRETI